MKAELSPLHLLKNYFISLKNISQLNQATQLPFNIINNIKFNSSETIYSFVNQLEDVNKRFRQLPEQSSEQILISTIADPIHLKICIYILKFSFYKEINDAASPYREIL